MIEIGEIEETIKDRIAFYEKWGNAGFAISKMDQKLHQVDCALLAVIQAAKVHPESEAILAIRLAWDPEANRKSNDCIVMRNGRHEVIVVNRETVLLSGSRPPEVIEVDASDPIKVNPEDTGIVEGGPKGHIPVPPVLPATEFFEHMRLHPDPPRKCECSMRVKLVGDGCDICNPERAKDFQDPET